MNKIRAITKRPGGKPVHTWITPSLENLQTYVGGYIETVTLASDLVIICNEEGRLIGLPYNCNICGVSLVGDIIICGVNGDKFADLPCSYGELKRLLSDLWRDPPSSGCEQTIMRYDWKKAKEAAP